MSASVGVGVSVVLCFALVFGCSASIFFFSLEFAVFSTVTTLARLERSSTKIVERESTILNSNLV